MNAQLFLCPRCQCHLLPVSGRAPDACVHCGHRWGQNGDTTASLSVGRSGRALMLGLLVGGSVMATGLTACTTGDEGEGSPTVEGTPAVTGTPATTATPTVNEPPGY